jgi:hypothetical protein
MDGFVGPSLGVQPQADKRECGELDGKEQASQAQLERLIHG